MHVIACAYQKKLYIYTSNNNKNNNKMDYFKFNRQAIMTAEQRSDILKVLTRNFRMSFDLQNEIYGLFDGYYYFGIAERVFADTNIQHEDKMIMNNIFDNILKATK